MFIVKSHKFLLTVIRKLVMILIMLGQSLRIFFSKFLMPLTIWIVLLLQILMMLQTLMMLLCSLTYSIQGILEFSRF
jgi:hypothetical protein